MLRNKGYDHNRHNTLADALSGVTGPEIPSPLRQAYRKGDRMGYIIKLQLGFAHGLLPEESSCELISREGDKYNLYQRIYSCPYSCLHTCKLNEQEEGSE